MCPLRPGGWGRAVSSRTPQFARRLTGQSTRVPGAFAGRGLARQSKIVWTVLPIGHGTEVSWTCPGYSPGSTTRTEAHLVEEAPAPRRRPEVEAATPVPQLGMHGDKVLWQTLLREHPLDAEALERPQLHAETRQLELVLVRLQRHRRDRLESSHDAVRVVALPSVA